jgi:hypothetical protein
MGNYGDVAHSARYLSVVIERTWSSKSAASKRKALPILKALGRLMREIWEYRDFFVILTPFARK